ncbi:Oligosaccharide 4-alpha-D-glucosyltransferase [Pelomyxa schiedti]|nr:Oligosaccharide 4-alpha-D-glucosyltransferase [Pelomyxa schiedti]
MQGSGIAGSTGVGCNVCVRLVVVACVCAVSLLGRLEASGLGLRESQAANGTVYEGGARFVVYTSTLVRMEYSSSGLWEDSTTLNVINRASDFTDFTTSVVSGWRQIKTSNIVVYYQVGSGAFSSTNLKVLLVPSKTVVYPFKAQAANNLKGWVRSLDGANGAVSLNDGIFTTNGWYLLDDTDTAVRQGDWMVTRAERNQQSSRGVYDTTTLVQYWNEGRTDSLLCGTNDCYSGNPDYTMVRVEGYQPNSYEKTAVQLFDYWDSTLIDNYATTLSTPPSGYTPAWFSNGYVLSAPQTDITHSISVWWSETRQDFLTVGSDEGISYAESNGYILAFDDIGWIYTSPPAKQYQDTYFFGYENNFKTALTDFMLITALKYYAYTDDDYRNDLIPMFRSEKVPLDVLSIDTDWKSPNTWDGWEWNSALFPDPDDFISWADSEGLVLNLNVHPSIVTDDPKYSECSAITGDTLKTDTDGKKCFDWSIYNHTEAFFWLMQPFEQEGIRFWWNDWCCECQGVSNMAGLPADCWLNFLYKYDVDQKGLRGFSMSRIGAALGSSFAPGGAWSEHRSSMHFTGDTYDTWDMLSFEAYVTPRESAIGVPYVTHDIGSHLGTHLADDLYLRWVQLGSFQPIFRLHSQPEGERLPWEYPPVQTQAEDMMRLRHSLLPYTYTTAWQAATTGLPMNRPLFLEYPGYTAAYSYSHEFMFGDSLLVAPVLTSGMDEVSTELWLPPGVWFNWFDSSCTPMTGPAVVTVVSTLDDMPLFARKGCIIPMESYSDWDPLPANVDPLVLRIFSGENSTFTMYEDGGDGQEWQTGAYSTTFLQWTEQSPGVIRSGGSGTLAINSRQGTYGGASQSRAYQITVAPVASSGPLSVQCNGKQLPCVDPDSTDEGWWYDTTNLSTNVRLNSLSVSAAVSVTFTF